MYVFVILLQNRITLSVVYRASVLIQKGEKLGTIRTLGYHKYPCGSELVYSKRDFQTFYLNYYNKEQSCSINISVHHRLLTLYGTLNQCFFVPSSLLEYFIFVLHIKLEYLQNWEQASKFSQ